MLVKPTQGIPLYEIIYVHEPVHELLEYELCTHTSYKHAISTSYKHAISKATHKHDRHTPAQVKAHFLQRTATYPECSTYPALYHLLLRHIHVAGLFICQT